MNSNEQRVIILADGHDSHVPLVTRHLAQEPIFVDTCQMDCPHLAFELGEEGEDPEGQPSILYKGKGLHPASKVWYRSLCAQTLFATGLSVSADPLHPALIALNELLPNPDNWVSARDAIIGATSLIKQQVAARRVGLHAPPTLITASLDKSRAFIQRYQRCSVRPLMPIDNRDPNRYTRLVRKTDQSQIEHLPGPFRILQAYTEPKSELRVVVVGSQTFTALISNPLLHMQKEELQVRHWRVSLDPALFAVAPAPLPDRIAQQCIRLVSELGLKTAVIDLAVARGPEGYILQSVHPNGNWDFLENKASLPIGAAMAQLFMAK